MVEHNELIAFLGIVMILVGSVFLLMLKNTVRFYENLYIGVLLILVSIINAYDFDLRVFKICGVFFIVFNFAILIAVRKAKKKNRKKP